MRNRNTLVLIALTGALAAGNITSFAQGQGKDDSTAMKIYRATPARINDVTHTKLAVRFDYKKC